MPGARVIRLPSICNLEAYVGTLSKLNRAIASGAEAVTLDFARVERAYPDCMAPLICSLHRLQHVQTLSVEVIPPRDSSLSGLFDGVGWTHFLTLPDAHFEPIPRRTRTFTPIRPFESEDDLQLLHRGVMDVLVSQASLAKDLPEALEWALWEVMDNVLRHSNVGLGWVQASAFPRRGHLNIVVVDHGVGVRDSLAQAYPELDEAQAIRKAVEQGVTRDPSSGAGWGLRGCRQIVRLNRGSMILFSGKTEFREHVRVRGWGAGRTETQVGDYVSTPAGHQGTVVELQLRMSNPVDLGLALGGRRPPAIIEMLHARGNEYVFDVASEAPNFGTREAGRRVRQKVINLSRSDPEQPIVLDFSGVDMVSSSFVDELVGKLAASMGRALFEDRIELRAMTSSVNTVTQLALWDRLRSE